MQKRLILASASPRRKELLAGAGLEFEIMVSNADEVKSGLMPEELAAHNARVKALDAASRSDAGGAFVLGADTIVVIDGEILGKPADADDAMRMLSMLNGRTHTVITGYCIVTPDGGCESGTVSSDVLFNNVGRQALEDYIATGEPFDKAGSYAVQGIGGALVKEIRGDRLNVIGLPLKAIDRLKELTV